MFFCPSAIYRPLTVHINLWQEFHRLFMVSLVWLFLAFVRITSVALAWGSYRLDFAWLLMILPTIISVSEAAIRAVPRSYYEGGLVIWASHERAASFCSTASS